MYKCLSCGAQMRYDPEKGKLVCSYCGESLGVWNHPDEKLFQEGRGEEARQSGYDITVFTCPQCGGEILSMENQVSDFCSYCGASVTLEGRLTNASCPKKILPFGVSREEIKEEYRKHVKSLHFVPKEFKSEEFREKFCGIYMPYWAYTVSQKGEALLKGCRKSGDATEYCDVSVDLDTVYDDIFFDASSAFDDSLSDEISYFVTDKMKDFSPAYLMGFYADMPDVDNSVYEADAIEAADRRTFQNLASADRALYGMAFDESENKSAIRSKVSSSQFVLLPVWFLTWRVRNRKGDRVVYAVANGKSRTMKAEVPVDVKKCLLLALLAAIPLSFVLFLILPAMMPVSAMLLSALLMVCTMILYQKHMQELLRREFHLDDAGFLKKNDPGKLKGQRRRRNGKSAGIKGIMGLLPVIVFFFYGKYRF